MSKKKTLKWGWTPWDKMSREELLREVERMYSALVSVNSALNLTRFQRESHPFYMPGGTGGDALEKARQILEPLHAQFEDGEETLYRAFFRYAVDLLFERREGFRIGAGWAVCPVCGAMYGETRLPDGRNISLSGKTCSSVFSIGDCSGILRPLAWEDLEARKGRR